MNICDKETASEKRKERNRKTPANVSVELKLVQNPYYPDPVEEAVRKKVLEVFTLGISFFQQSMYSCE